MQTFVNPDTLNMVAKDKIAGMQRHAEIANQARICWAIRFLSFNTIRPNLSARPSAFTQQTELAHS